MKKNQQFLTLSFLAFLLIIISFSLFRISLAQSEPKTGSSSETIDAIGVRVLPNPNHYSIARWYQSQGFYGSPQSLVVDGYEAIRDGRTVYVSAANIVGKNVYTNIYLISYNQDPSETTVDILGQIVSRWKFNNNLESLESESQASCSISSISCVNNSDCPQGSICSQEGLSQGSCQLQETENCRSDSDCPTNFFCDSDKAKITRDMQRIGRLGEMKEALANYYRTQGHYPILAAGTYLANKSISLWPSWQQLLLDSIAVSPNFVDPINRLGFCPGFDAKTCWDINENRFYSNSSDSNGNLTLPAGSYAIVYESDTDGANYNLCATLESRHPSLDYNFVGSNLSPSLCVSDTGVDTIGSSFNSAPVLVDYNLSGQAGKEFNGYIRVSDADNDPLKWEIIKGTANWNSWSQDAFRIIDTSNKSQKKIFASLAPNTNSSFPITLKVSDGRGGVLSKDLSVEIQDYGVFIEAQNAVHVLDKNVPLLYNFYVSGDNLDNPPKVSFVKISGPEVPPFFSLSPLAPMINNRYQLTFQADLDPSIYQFPESEDFVFEILVTDKSNSVFKKRFSLKLISEKPTLQFSCANTTRINQDYSCLLGKTDYFGRGFSYSVSGQPKDLKIIIDEDKSEAYLKGKASQTGDYPISVSVRSDYGVVITKEFNLKVNTFCGDQKLGSPNSEGRGGPNNDGYEICDGIAGTTNYPQDSSANKQYACSTYNSDTPLEITTNTYCIFKGSLNGGGYCGDDYCQTKYENKTNCSQDCSDGSALIPEDFCNYDTDCESWQNCNQITKRCEVAPGSCDPVFGDKDCLDGFKCNAENNKCEAEVFSNLETTKNVTLRTGDITRDPRIKDCSIIEVDNPFCYDFDENNNYDQFPGCPLACNNGSFWLGKTADSDTCRDKSPWFGSNWYQRNIYSCYNAIYVSRKVGEPCRTTLGSTAIDGIMSAEGKCVKTDSSTPPTSSSCGDGICDFNGSENCDNCAQDCGQCLLPCYPLGKTDCENNRSNGCSFNNYFQICENEGCVDIYNEAECESKACLWETNDPRDEREDILRCR
ncbi:hypothetical protein JXK06_00500 [Patescibacteria group bacterium]|nr:hypothetical protein [Patescibacteria group bacterium]